jgi:hypothetical protein
VQRGKVLSVCAPRYKDAHEAAGEYVKRMVARVHDAASGHEGGGDAWHKHDEGLPDLALGVEHV